MIYACQHCDHLIKVPPLTPTQSAYCHNCGSVVYKSSQSGTEQIIAASLAGILFLLSALLYPFISFSNQGLSQTIHLLDAAKILISFDNLLLGALLDASIIGFPLSLLILFIPLHMGIIGALPHKIGSKLLKTVSLLRPWVMCEIFLIAVLISMIKIMAMAEIEFGLSFWSFCGFVICYCYAVSKLNMQNLWQQLPTAQAEFPLPKMPMRAMECELRACHHCQLLSELDDCPRCHSKTYLRKKKSLQRVLAYSISSLIFYIPANLLPIMHTWVFNSDQPSTIIGGVFTLWEIGSYPIAIVIFIASIIIPISKLVVLFWLCYVAARSVNINYAQATQLYRLTEFIGRWSMIDVFVVITLVALVQLGVLMSITPGIGAIFFAAMVITSMLGAHSFDPRLIWDKKVTL